MTVTTHSSGTTLPAMRPWARTVRELVRLGAGQGAFRLPALASKKVLPEMA